MRNALMLTFIVSFCSFAQTSYTPDNAVRKEIANTLWEALKAKTPAAGTTMMQYLMTSDEVFQLYENAVGKNGINPYEIGVVAGFVEDVCKEVSSGVSITEAESFENVKKMQTYYKANGIDENMSNLQKQRKYDVLILKTIWVGSVNELELKNSVVAKAMAKELLATSRTGVATGPKLETTASVQTSNETPSPKKTYNTNGTNSNAIKDVVMITTTSYGLGGMYVSNDVYALLTNGESLYEPSEPLETMDINASKRKNPKHWDSWEIKNNVFYIIDGQDGDVSDWETWFKVRPAKKGFRINGTFKTSDPFTGGSIINSSIVYFDALGRFEWKTTKGGLGGWRPVLVNKNSSGTYTIADRTITLNYGNGTSESLFFGLYPKDDAHFIIGSSHFLPVKK